MRDFELPQTSFKTEEELRQYVNDNSIYFNQYQRYSIYVDQMLAYFYPTELGGVLVYYDGSVSYNKWYGLAVSKLDEDLNKVLVHTNKTGIGMVTILSLLDVANQRIIEKLPIEEQRQKFHEFIIRNSLND